MFRGLGKVGRHPMFRENLAGFTRKNDATSFVSHSSLCVGIFGAFS